jgi:hypothetical protein
MKIFIDSVNNTLDIFNVKLEKTGNDFGLFIYKDTEKNEVSMDLYEVRKNGYDYEGYGITLSSRRIGIELEFDYLREEMIRRCPNFDSIFDFLSENKNRGRGR